MPVWWWLRGFSKRVCGKAQGVSLWEAPLTQPLLLPWGRGLLCREKGAVDLSLAGCLPHLGALILKPPSRRQVAVGFPSEGS